MNKDQISAFWSKVDMKNSAKECWEWTGAKKPKGYGNVRVNKKYKLAHRVSFEICNGEIPEGFIVCHICDNPSCCNPDHLMLGTIKSNAADMLLKGRQKGVQFASVGTNNGMSKLSEDDVISIRKMYRNKELNQYELAEKFGVSQPAIGSIVRNKTWRHVKCPEE